jgi:hypothetical protein
MLNLSIHPRNWPSSERENMGYGKVKANTSKPPRRKKANAGITAKFDRRARSFDTVDSRKQPSRTRPGSRNPRRQG